MSRSVKKGPALDEKLMKKVAALNATGDKAVIKTWSRWSTRPGCAWGSVHDRGYRGESEHPQLYIRPDQQSYREMERSRDKH